MYQLEVYSQLCRDDKFRATVPPISQCRGGFDFTVTFEESIFSLGPACTIIAIVPLRLYNLSKRTCKVKSSWELKVKLLGFAALSALHATLLALFSRTDVAHRAILISSALFQLLASISLGALSYWEHRNATRPSFLLSMFLFLTSVLDSARARTQFLIPGQAPVGGILLGTVVIKVLLLLLENKDKRNILLPEYSKTSSELRSGLFSRAFFTWLFPVLSLGFKSIISSDDLPAINEKLASQSLAAKVAVKWNKRTSIGALSLLFDVLTSFPKELCIVLISTFVQVGLNICQPFLIQELVTFLGSPHLSTNLGYGLLGGFFCVSMTNALVIPWGFHYSSRLMIMARGALVSMIYEKLLRLRGDNLHRMTAFTLVTADVETIVNDSWRLFDPWANLLQISIGTYLLYQQLGAVCCVPILVIFLTFTLVALVGSHIPAHQGTWFKAIEKRIDLTSHILGCLPQIKLLGLSRSLEDKIQTRRRDELQSSKKFRVSNCLALASAYAPQTLAPLITFGAFSISKLVSNEPNFPVTTAVTSFSIINLISTPAMQLLLAIPMGAQAIGSYGRIQDFLQIAETPGVVKFDTGSLGLSNATTMPGKAAPSRPTLLGPEKKQSLEKVGKKAVLPGPPSINFTPNCIKAITGPSGCGKSTVLRELIAREETRTPSLFPSSDIAYCSQAIWIFDGTIRDNIIGQSEMDIVWYENVIRSCELQVDLDRMPKGDASEVGSRGSKLSGGQRQRVAIARALYSKKKRAIFDDVTSALDGHTLSALTNNLFSENGILRSNAMSVIVATHSVQVLQLADQVLLMGQDGQVVDSGTYEELVDRHEYFNQHQNSGFLRHPSEQVILDQLQELELSRGEYEARTLTKVDDLRRKKGHWRSFTYYLRGMGWLGVVVFIIGTGVYVVLNAVSGVWLTWWAEDTANSRGLGFWLGLYATWAILITLGVLLAPVLFFTKLAYKASDVMHFELLKATMRAPLSVLTNTEDTGSLVNRFSQDIRLCDWQLPFNTLLTLMALFVCLASIGVAIAAVPYIAIGTPVLALVLYLLQLLYLRTSRQLRLLEIEQKAPIVSLFLDSIQGITTIHSFNWSPAYMQRSFSLLDSSQKPYYLLFCVQRWLILVLALIATGMEVVVIGLAIVLRTSVSAGLVGLAVIHVTTLAKSLSDLVMQWTEMETSLGAVSRIYKFTHETPGEVQSGDEVSALPEGWPLAGSITFENVSATYETQIQDSPALALSNITFTIREGEKIGICGRSGSGKSSLMATLVSLLPCHQGRIFIDGTDISTIGPEAIRSKLNYVTQEPFIFDGTIRENLNPWEGQVGDDAMVRALEKANIWRKVESLGGLDATVASDSFSHGEKQLFCLARSLLRNSRILILDEPTGHIDPATDAIIQQVIRQEFSGRTILMIAHRLRSLIEFDTVIVLESGHVREMGHPQTLLSDPTSAFSALSQLVEGTNGCH